MKKLHLLLVMMAFVMLPLSSCIDEPESWMPDFDVHTYEVDYGNRNYIYHKDNIIYFNYIRPDFSLTGATIEALGRVIHADSESIELDIYGGTSFPNYLEYKKDKGYVIRAQIVNLSKNKVRDVRYYFYFFEQNGKLYYSYQRIQ